MKNWAVSVALLSAVMSSSAHGAFSTYSIGNSLTVDSQVAEVARQATARGVSTQSDWHIHTGVGLDYMWNNPNEINLGSYFAGPYPTALAGRAWDAITLEPFSDSLTGPTGDVTRVIDFMNYARSANAGNANAQFYVFARWSEQAAFSGTTYADHWNNTTYTGGNGTSTQSADYFNQLMSQVAIDQPADMKTVKLIPTGFVFAAIDQEIRAGHIAGLTDISQLYRDNLHLSTLGSWVAVTTFYATMFSDDPTGLRPSYSVYPWAELANTDPALLDQLEGIVWRTVTTTQYTGVVVPEPGMAVAGIFPLVAMLARPRRRQA